MITYGRYKHSFLNDTWAEVTDGDNELVIYTEITPKGSKEDCCSVPEIFSELWFLPADWKPNPHADLLRAVAAHIEKDPTAIDRLQELVDSFKEIK